MYGLCHTGIKQFVIEEYGNGTWKNIEKKSGCSGDVDVAAYFDDSVTGTIFESLLEFAEDEPTEVFKKFGSFWIDFVSSSKYKTYLQIEHDSFATLIESVNSTHARLKAILPEMKVPHFEVEKVSEEYLVLHYYSQRDGLWPMVNGLLEKMAQANNYEIQLENISLKEKTEGRDTFGLTLTKIQNLETA